MAESVSVVRMESMRRSSGAFTLIEVLVALAILATALVVLLEAHGFGVRMSKDLRDETLAALLAEDLMSRIEAEGNLQDGEASGEFKEYPGYWWHMYVDRSPFFDDVYMVRLEVLWGDPNAPRSFVLLHFIPEFIYQGRQ